MSFTKNSDKSAKCRFGKTYYYEVALPLSLKENLIYSSHWDFQKGDSVLVTLRGQKRSGVVLKKVAVPIKKDFDIKPILSVDLNREPLSSARLKWLFWLAEYYQHYLGPVIHLSFPPSFGTSKKGVLKTAPLKSPGSSSHPVYPMTTENSAKPALTREQKRCLEEIQLNSIDRERTDFKGLSPLGKSYRKPEKASGISVKPKCVPSSPLLREQVLLGPVFSQSEETISSKEIEKSQEHKSSGFRVHLLHGVTGSGKTEIYLRLAEPCLRQGKSVLILVPEIALTSQHIQRFSSRFPEKVACFHSGLSPREKHRQWVSVLKGEKKILIGPRSALFCPLPGLSWIIVDEEHESHFKQEEKLKYHGRDAAVYLGKCLNIPVILASATPSMESWWNAQTGKYIYHHLKKRVFETKIPKLELVDMKKEKRQGVLPYWLSKPLYSALEQSLKKQEQSALFLNRRGENCVFCPACAYCFSCANCDIALTQHQSSHLLCHYCGFREEKPRICPECGQDGLFSFGVGTARLQKELSGLFPQARIIRADRDIVKTHKQWACMLDQIEKKEVDIIIGTQMIAKGLDFPYLNLVGVILADQGLSRPDFRSAEKSFQLITQMAGRAGRRKTPGRVILQSYYPAHPVITALEKGDYEQFAEQELSQRKKYNYPPFGKLSLVRVQSITSSSALRAGLHIQEKLKNIKNMKVLGPAPAPYFRLRNKYRYHLLLKSKGALPLEQAGAIIRKVQKERKLRVRINISRDPVYML